MLDLLFLKKDEDGNLEAFEATDLPGGEFGDLRAEETALAMLLSEQDVEDLAETGRARQRPPCSSGRTSGRRRSERPSDTRRTASPAAASRSRP